MIGILDRLRARWRWTAPRPGELRVGDLSVQVLRKPVRNLTLRVSFPDGRVRVSAPHATSDAFIRRAILDKLPWIERHRARIAALPPPAVLPPLAEADREALKLRIAPLISKWELALGVTVATWGVKQMKTRWGSCNPRTRRVWLSLELARRPPQCLDYVVLHELAHLLERGHDARFRAILYRHMPDWEMRRSALRQFA